MSVIDWNREDICDEPYLAIILSAEDIFGSMNIPLDTFIQSFSRKR